MSASGLTARSTFLLDDTIAALATPPGPGARAIIRLSGPAAWSIARVCVARAEAVPGDIRRGLWDVLIMPPGVTAGLPARLVAFAAPRSFTGQDMVELHMLSSPPLVQAVLRLLFQRGAREARPGEFTLRAFLAGKLDLSQAEAVLGVIEAEDRESLRSSLDQMAGGITRPLERLRQRLLDLLAGVEASLDFADEDLELATRAEIESCLRELEAWLLQLAGQVAARGVSRRPFRVVLAGHPNVGKSSLLNALAGREAALVSDQAGTTRDFVVARIQAGRQEIELIDTAGEEAPAEPLGRLAQDARLQQIAAADLVLWCQDCRDPDAFRLQALADLRARHPERQIQPVLTKGDLGPPTGGADPVFRTSARTGAGIASLRSWLGEQCRRQSRGTFAHGLPRSAHHLDACLERTHQALALAAQGGEAELLALELRLALDEIGELTGAVCTDELLDRVFSRFCIGK